MKKSYLKTLEGKLITCGPVFIGSGREITKKEYLLLDRRTKAGIIDTESFYDFLRKKGLSGKYEDFLLHEKRMDLFSWLKNVGLRSQEITPYMKYIIPIGDIGQDMSRAKWEVKESIKDPYGCPYVPGSSIKGMLRTILLSGQIMSGGIAAKAKAEVQSGSRNPNPRRNTFLQRESRMLEAVVFNSLNRNERKKEDAVNDSLSGLIVSDSAPLSTNDLVLCQKVEIHTDGREKVLNLMRECVKPGTAITFSITIDPSLCKETKESIERAVSDFDAMYIRDFLKSFRYRESLPDGAVFLGGGSGYVSKTVSYPLMGKDEGIRFVQNVFDKTKVPYSHKHNMDREYGVSPHILKCSRIGGNLYQMGLCSLKLE